MTAHLLTATIESIMIAASVMLARLRRWVADGARRGAAEPEATRGDRRPALLLATLGIALQGATLSLRWACWAAPGLRSPVLAPTRRRAAVCQ